MTHEQDYKFHLEPISEENSVVNSEYSLVYSQTDGGESRDVFREVQRNSPGSELRAVQGRKIILTVIVLLLLFGACGFAVYYSLVHGEKKERAGSLHQAVGGILDTATTANTLAKPNLYTTPSYTKQGEVQTPTPSVLRTNTHGTQATVFGGLSVTSNSNWIHAAGYSSIDWWKSSSMITTTSDMTRNATLSGVAASAQSPSTINKEQNVDTTKESIALIMDFVTTSKTTAPLVSGVSRSLLSNGVGRPSQDVSSVNALKTTTTHLVGAIQSTSNTMLMEDKGDSVMETPHPAFSSKAALIPLHISSRMKKSSSIYQKNEFTSSSSSSSSSPTSSSLPSSSSSSSLPSSQSPSSPPSSSIPSSSSSSQPFSSLLSPLSSDLINEIRSSQSVEFHQNPKQVTRIHNSEVTTSPLTQVPHSEVFKQTMSRYSFQGSLSNTLHSSKLRVTSERISRTKKADIPLHSLSVVVKDVKLSSFDVHQGTAITTEMETINAHAHVVATIPSLKAFPNTSVKFSTMTPTKTVLQSSETTVTAQNVSTHASGFIHHLSEPRRFTGEHYISVENARGSTERQETVFTSQNMHLTLSSTTAAIPRESIRLSSPITNRLDVTRSRYDRSEKHSTRLGLKTTVSEAKNSPLMNESLNLQTLNTISSSNLEKTSQLMLGNSSTAVAVATPKSEGERATKMPITTSGTIATTTKLTADADESITIKTFTTNAKLKAATDVDNSAKTTEQIATAETTTTVSTVATATPPLVPATSTAAAAAVGTAKTTKITKGETVYSTIATEVFPSRKFWYSSNSVVRLVESSGVLIEENPSVRSSARGKLVLTPSTRGTPIPTTSTQEKVNLTPSTRKILALTSSTQRKLALTSLTRRTLAPTPSTRRKLAPTALSYVISTPSVKARKSTSEEDYFSTVSSSVGQTHSTFQSFSVLKEMINPSANQSWSTFLPQISWRQTSVLRTTESAITNHSFELLKSTTARPVSGVLQASGVTMLFNSSSTQVVTISSPSQIMTSSTAGKIADTNTTLEYRYTEGSMRLVNVDYHHNLSDSNTTMFKALATSVVQLLSDILAGNQIQTEDIQVTEFRNGSVLVFFYIKLSSEYNHTAEFLKTVLHDSNTSLWRGYHVSNFTLRERLPSTPVPEEGDKGRREAGENDSHVVIPLVIAMVILLLVVCFLGYRHCKRKDWHRRRRIKPKGEDMRSGQGTEVQLVVQETNSAKNSGLRRSSTMEKNGVKEARPNDARTSSVNGGFGDYEQEDRGVIESPFSPDYRKVDI